MPGGESKVDWSPGIGMRRAVGWGGLCTAILILLSAPVAWYFPMVLSAALLRAFFAFLVAWILFGVTQRAAGMAGWPVTLLALAFSALVLISHHFVWFAHGFPSTKGVVIGWVWLEPATIALVNMTAAIGLGACALMRHSGGGDLQTLLDLFGQRIR